jgi:sulfide dehydrogenase cytochrome subunit
MKMICYLRFTIIFLASFGLVSVSAETPTASMLANTCAGCHGTKGSSVGPASPTIAGISRDYFIDTMEAYKTGDRPSTIMSRIAKGYSKEEIVLMAEFFSKQKFIRQAQTFDAKKAKLGKKLHKKFCEKCHQNGGSSAEDDMGILAGQWQAYIRFTMQDFMSGNRDMEKKKIKKMKNLAKKHGKSGVDALLHYYASQSGEK